MKTIQEPAQDLPVVAENEVVVVGGGPGGIMAALAAARTGADTLLVERYGFLGGMATAGLMTSFNGSSPIITACPVRKPSARLPPELHLTPSVCPSVQGEYRFPSLAQDG